MSQRWWACTDISMALVLFENAELGCWSMIREDLALLLASGCAQVPGSRIERVANVRSSTYLSSGMILVTWLHAEVSALGPRHVVYCFGYGMAKLLVGHGEVCDREEGVYASK